MTTIAELRERVTAAEPIVRHNLTVIPLRLTRETRPPRYITFAAGRGLGKVSITEVSEGGSVPQLVVVNDSDRPVLLIDGEELIGAKQNRIVNLTILVPAGQRLNIPVSCVEAGRWAWKGRHFTESPNAMYAAARARKTKDVNASLRRTGARIADQGAVWQDVAEISAAMSVASPTSAMSDVFEQRRTTIEELIDGVAPLENQVGAVFAIDGRAAGLELFDSPLAFAEYYRMLLRSYAVDALSRRSNGAPAAVSNAVIDELFASLSAARAERFPAMGLGEDVRWENGGLAGGGLEWEGEFVHVVAFVETASPGNGRGRRGPFAVE